MVEREIFNFISTYTHTYLKCQNNTIEYTAVFTTSTYCLLVCTLTEKKLPHFRLFSFVHFKNLIFSAPRVEIFHLLSQFDNVAGMRILVMLLLDTLPMLGNVLLLCFFVFFIFGIVGVQLWEGILRQRCFLKQLPNISYPQ